jgi:hypothetical protein
MQLQQQNQPDMRRSPCRNGNAKMKVHPAICLKTKDREIHCHRPGSNAAAPAAGHQVKPLQEYECRNEGASGDMYEKKGTRKNAESNLRGFCKSAGASVMTRDTLIVQIGQQ